VSNPFDSIVAVPADNGYGSDDGSDSLVAYDLHDDESDLTKAQRPIDLTVCLVCPCVCSHNLGLYSDDMVVLGRLVLTLSVCVEAACERGAFFFHRAAPPSPAVCEARGGVWFFACAP